MRLSALCLAVSLLAACGPSVAGDSGETTDGGVSTSSAEGGDPTTASSVGTTADPSTTMPGTSVGTSMTSVDESDGGADEGLFVNPFDLDPTITGCSIWERDCPPGMKCMPYANDGGAVWNDTKCSTIADDPRQVGDPCSAWNESPTSGVDDCDFHMMCWDVDLVTLNGTCVEFCVGSEEDPSCTDPATACVQTGSGILALCLSRCHPLDDLCPAPTVCLPANDAFQCVPRRGGNLELGDDCEFQNECVQGLFCASGRTVPGCAAESCCAAFCDTSAADPCETVGVACVPWWREGEAPPGYEELGACVMP